MSRLGVIPAAGSGSRWGGYYKELLPCGPGEWLLDRCVRAMTAGGADAVLVISRPDKVAAHAAHLTGLVDIPVFYAMQRGGNDIWSAIEESFNFPADDYLFAMPDTYFPLDGFKGWTGDSFGMGLFETQEPERFGVLIDRVVMNKLELGPGVYQAWGLLYWDSRNVELWQKRPPADYTQAINHAIQVNPEIHGLLDYYHDFAAYADYQQWMAAA